MSEVPRQKQCWNCIKERYIWRFGVSVVSLLVASGFAVIVVLAVFQVWGLANPSESRSVVISGLAKEGCSVLLNANVEYRIRYIGGAYNVDFDKDRGKGHWRTGIFAYLSNEPMMWVSPPSGEGGMILNDDVVAFKVADSGLALTDRLSRRSAYRTSPIYVRYDEDANLRFMPVDSLDYFGDNGGHVEIEFTPGDIDLVNGSGDGYGRDEGLCQIKN